MTREQKSILAAKLLDQAGNILEYLDEMLPELSDVPRDEIQKALSGWLSKLPGDVWDTRLGKPPPKR